MMMLEYFIESMFGGHKMYAVAVNVPDEETASYFQEWLTTSNPTSFITTKKCIESKWFSSLTEAEEAANAFNISHCIGGEVGDRSCYYATTKKISAWKMLWWWLRTEEHDHLEEDDREEC